MTVRKNGFTIQPWASHGEAGGDGTRRWASPKGKGPERTDISMDVDLIFKIAAIGIIVAVLNQVLIRSGREEQAMLTTLAGLIVVLTMVVTEISDLFRMVKSVFGL